MACGALSLIQQSQNQTIFRVIFHMRRMWGIVPRTKRSPFPRCLTLASGQVYNNLVLRKGSRNIQYVDKQTLRIAVNGLRPRSTWTSGLS